MRILRTPAGMRRLAEGWRRRGLGIGLVPTMGALHEGHLSLIRRARRENDRVVVSVFVNPLQFGPGEDYRRYPRPWARDRRLCRRAGVDAIYGPPARALYPAGFSTTVEVSGLSEPLCGRLRPGHFRGVATVVLKLMAAVMPRRAYFGEKDFQQLQVIRRMARDLDLGVAVVGCPIVREPDGLALSSRNAYLGPVERARAPALHRALRLAAALARRGRRSPRQVIARMRRQILREIPGARVDYFSIVDPRTLRDAHSLRGPLRLAAAVRVGGTRLIDNVAVR